MPFFTVKTRNGRTLRILVDTGSNKNYIKPSLVINPQPNQELFAARAVKEEINVSHHTYLDIFEGKVQPLQFFLLPGLKTFDCILGNDTMRELSAVIYTKENYTNKPALFPRCKEYRTAFRPLIRGRNLHNGEYCDTT